MKQRNSKRARIKRLLVERVGNLPPDTRLPTERELCEKFDVARMTVSKALAELVEEKALYRIQGRGTFVGYRPGGERTIFFVGNRNDWNCEPLAHTQSIFMKMQNLAYEKHINIELLDVNAQNNASFDPTPIKRLRSDDKVFLYFSPSHIPEMYQLLAESGSQITHMCFDTEVHKIFAPFRRHWHSLYYDRKKTIKKAIRLLTPKGRKKIALLTYVNHVEFQHVSGYREGIIAAGLALEPNLILSTPNTVASAFGYCKNLLLLRRLYSFDALITSHAAITIGAQKAIEDSGISIPDDIALLSMDDSRELRDNITPVSAMVMPETAIIERVLEIITADSYAKGAIETYTGEFKERKTT